MLNLNEKPNKKIANIAWSYLYVKSKKSQTYTSRAKCWLPGIRVGEMERCWSQRVPCVSYTGWISSGDNLQVTIQSCILEFTKRVYLKHSQHTHTLWLCEAVNVLTWLCSSFHNLHAYQNIMCTLNVDNFDLWIILQ